MLILMLGLALVSVFASIWLLVGSIGGGSRSRDGGPPKGEVPEGAPGPVKVFFPLISAFAGPARAVKWPSYRERSVAAIARAGWGDAFTMNHLIGMKILMAIVVPVLAALLLAAVRNPAVFLLTGVLAFFAPDVMLSNSRKAREQAIIRTLPSAVDVLSLSVEAGLEFLIALERLVKRGLSGP